MSLSAARIKLVKSLKQKKFRQTYHKFVVEGVKMVAELVLQSAYSIEVIYALPGWSNPGFPEELIVRVNDRELGRMSQLATPNEVLAVLGLPQVGTSRQSSNLGSEPKLENSKAIAGTQANSGTTTGHLEAWPTILQTGWSIYLDGVQSPANLGAIMRVAEWFGFKAVIRGPETADLYNHKSLQASMGSFLRIPSPELDLSEIKTAIPDLPLYGTATTGDSIYDFQPPDRGLLVIGREGSGIRPKTNDLLENYLRIPQAETSRAESLNAAVAAGVACSHITLNSR
ncbi:MAG: TrmH family RNA methyltransferase [Bacteroidota bacterium]